ncbi:hypothetical protein D7Y09_00735 [bacterium 1XD42-1]|nr:hypothetical protein D7X25_01230 [bacterium 1XD42-8]RKJ67675.1 hypothetical protein D7Y09_00735 [bacterium 1XD42-1]
MAINSLSASSYGLSGLVSGMDTETMVEKMLSGTKSKIVAQQQKKAQLEYKQQLYRDLATQLRNLQTNFFSFSNPTTNLLSDAFFSKMSAVTESKYFHATATSNAATGTSRVDFISQLAKAAKKTGTKKASGELRSSHGSAKSTDSEEVKKKSAAEDIVEAIKKFDENLKTEIKISVDGSGGTKTRTLKAEELKALAGMTDSQAAAELTKLLAKDDSGADLGIKVKSANGKLTFNTSGSGQTIMIDTDTTGKALLGLGSTNVKGSGSYTTKIDTRQLQPGFQVQLDGGERKTVYLDLSDLSELGALSESDLNTYLSNSDNVEKVQKSLFDAVQSGMEKTFGGAIQVTRDAATGEMLFSTKDTSRSFTITGTSGVMDILGIKTGSSNKMTTGMRLDQINFATALKGNDFEFSINGEDFHVTGDTTLTDLMVQINNSEAGVKLTYNENTDKFSLESTVSGEGSQIEMKQIRGNLLTALFGDIKGNTSVAGQTLTTSKTVEGAKNIPLDSTGGKVQFDIITADGRRRSVSVSVSPDKEKDGEKFTNKERIVEAINAALEKNEEAQMAGGIKFGFNGGKITITAGHEGAAIIAKAGPGTVMAQLGFENGQSNIAQATTKLGKIGGLTIASPNSLGLTGTSTIQDLVDELNASTDPTLKSYKFDWDANEGRLIVENRADGDAALNLDTLTGIKGLNELFGGDKSSGITFKAQTETLNTVKGQNSILSINGNQIERSSNDFTYEGVNYSLTQVFDGRQKDANGNFKLADGEFSIDKDGYYRDEDNNLVNDDDGNPRMKDGSEIYAYDEVAGEIDITRDTDQIYDGIVKFVDEYNKIMEKIHSLLVEDPDYKDYLPLTDEQKAEMSDREVELWEEKAKTGLLRGDSALNAIWSDLRSTIYSKPSGSDIGIYNIGITTNSSTEWGGQLVIDHSKLKEMINSDPEAIRQLFTDSVDGVATSLNNAINRAARSSSANPGRLVALAGSSKSDTSSSLYKQMKSIDDNLLTLQDRYDSEYQRYWSQFNAMEQYIQQMNQQASWLAQQLGG